MCGLKLKNSTPEIDFKISLMIKEMEDGLAQLISDVEKAVNEVKHSFREPILRGVSKFDFCKLNLDELTDVVDRAIVEQYFKGRFLSILDHPCLRR